MPLLRHALALAAAMYVKLELEINLPDWKFLSLRLYEGIRRMQRFVGINR